MKNLPHWNPEDLRQSPLFEPLHRLLSQFDPLRFPSLDELNALLSLQANIKLECGKSLRFVGQALGKLSFESQYEPRCYLSAEVQTREKNLHDLFNALVWLVFPQSKAAINIRHYLALTKSQLDLPTQRGRVRDMVTLFDESGVVVACAESSLSDLLREHEWKELFWSRRAEVNSAMGFYLFGHGLYEKAMHPYIGITGQGLIIPVAEEFFSWTDLRRIQHLDERVSAYLNDEAHCGNTSELTPVPLLGIPGWFGPNLSESFYEDKKYFRPRREC